MANDDLVPGFDALSEEPWQYRLTPWDGVSGGIVVQTFGPLHSYNEDVFYRKTELLVDRGFRHVVLDLAGSIWPEEGLYGRLLVFQSLLGKRGGAFVLIGLHPQVDLAFDLQRADKAPLNLRKTLDEAAEFFRVRDGSARNTVFPVISSCPFCGRTFRAIRPGGYRCTPGDCGYSLRIDEEGRETAYHGWLVPGFDDLPLRHLQVSATPLPSVSGALLFRHTGILEKDDVKAYRDRVRKAQAAGFGRMVFDLTGLPTTRYPFVHRALFERNLPAATGFLLAGMPAGWAAYWEEGICPPPPCPRTKTAAEAVERLRAEALSRRPSP